MNWEPVIGLEIHVQLKTRTKMFCRCETSFGLEPNLRTCPVCLSHPGTLPVANAQAIEWTVKLGLAIGSEIADRALFARKNYFYQDLPKGYQISQYEAPLCVGGSLVVPGPDGEHEIRINRAHLEEDAAKTIHVGGVEGRIVGAEHSLVDFNRGGTPLMEIVTEPDIHSAEEAKRFLQLLRQTVVELGISDAEMEKGTLRCDANISVRPAGSTELRTRCELKNMNSFNFIARGIEAEIARQIEVYESGGEISQDTYDFDAASGTLTVHRSKEEAEDYRYFPEPDLVPYEPEPELIERLKAEIPESPGLRLARLLGKGLEIDDALVINESPETAMIVERVLDSRLSSPKVVSAAVINDFRGRGIKPLFENANEIARLIEAKPELPREVYFEAVGGTVSSEFAVEPYLAQRAISDTSELEPLIERILAANPGQVEQYRGGKEGLLGFFVGQVMKESGGKANAKVVSELVRAKLSA
ncbi:MAG: Asp-tRNA(Asn)/Glu-tRNA(Gln) amidotransferase subunit GatB [Gaiellaceae bacterium]|jgi:aspartyl-tRNA(Asn)/glutamyl-tRNA(Gln) amidotransferase subunit B